MAIAELHNTPMVADATFTTADEVLKWASELSVNRKEFEGYFPSLWFRGHAISSWKLRPAVYRDKFTKRAEQFSCDQKYYELPETRRAELGAESERKRLNLERTIIHDFLQVGGHLLEPQSAIEAYFLAQHFGMPTRLLNWSTNPLEALFMAVADDNSRHAEQTGAVIAINPTAHLPEHKKPFRVVLAPDDPIAKDAIDVVMAWKKEPENAAHILPIRPNTRSGRVERQASCFTLHSYGSKQTENKTLRYCLIDADAKQRIRAVLSGLSINQFTVYNTLDRLSREFRSSWGLEADF
jgi:FRG domain